MSVLHWNHSWTKLSPRVDVPGIDVNVHPPKRCVNHAVDRLAWYKNADGEGTFEVGRDISTTSDGARGVAVADLDGDGNLDIVLAATADGVEWFKNSGAGVFGLGKALESNTSIGAT